MSERHSACFSCVHPVEKEGVEWERKRDGQGRDGLYRETDRQRRSQTVRIACVYNFLKTNFGYIC